VRAEPVPSCSSRGCDQIAAETPARRRGRSLAGASVVVLPADGAHGIARCARRFGAAGTGARLAGRCDVGEAHIVPRGRVVDIAEVPGSSVGLARLGSSVWFEDLGVAEHDLILAAFGNVPQAWPVALLRYGELVRQYRCRMHRRHSLLPSCTQRGQ
jgi:hypothetical protein